MKAENARKFTTIIEFWQTINVSDGFGGSTQTTEKIGDIFARYQEPRTNNFNSEQTSIEKIDAYFIIRNRAIDTNVHFVVYKGEKYTILGFEKTFLESQIKIRCVKI